jgi:hypothetical protein
MLKIERSKANKTLLTFTIFQKMSGETRELILKNINQHVEKKDSV